MNDLPGNDTTALPFDEVVSIPFLPGVGVNGTQPTGAGYAIAIFDEGSTAPAAGSNVTGNVLLTASATDGSGSGVASVAYYLDSTGGTAIGSASVSPYSVSWSTLSVAAGSHTLYAVATDTAGNVSAAASDSIITPCPMRPSGKGCSSIQGRFSTGGGNRGFSA